MPLGHFRGVTAVAWTQCRDHDAREESESAPGARVSGRFTTSVGLAGQIDGEWPGGQRFRRCCPLHEMAMMVPGPMSRTLAPRSC